MQGSIISFLLSTLLSCLGGAVPVYEYDSHGVKKSTDKHQVPCMHLLALCRPTLSGTASLEVGERISNVRPTALSTPVWLLLLSPLSLLFPLQFPISTRSTHNAVDLSNSYHLGRQGIARHCRLDMRHFGTSVILGNTMRAATAEGLG